ncbi:MAG: succinate dehydrogenase [Burkholderiales bacterium]|jgi:fumarate reductase subunit C|nr:succinate dehydrogenase [Burkholderiales bacterium]
MAQTLFVLQRLSALVMAPLVLMHLVLIVYAVRDGLSAGEILSRTQGHWGWIFFYFLFVISVSIHVPIGMRNVMLEWSDWNPSLVNALSWLMALVLFLLGMRAVVAVGGLLL